MDGKQPRESPQQAAALSFELKGKIGGDVVIRAQAT